MMRGGRWYCHLASASLCGTLESGRLNESDVEIYCDEISFIVKLN